MPGEASLQCYPGRGAGASGSLTSCSRSATFLQLQHPGKPALHEENHPDTAAPGQAAPSMGKWLQFVDVPGVSGLRVTQRLLLHPPASLSLRISPASPPLGGQRGAGSPCSLPAPSHAALCERSTHTPKLPFSQVPLVPGLLILAHFHDKLRKG